MGTRGAWVVVGVPGCGGGLPELIGEDESAQLQISENDAVLVAVGHGSQHLSEKTPGLIFTQLFPASHVHVHVAVVSRQEGVRPILPDHHVQEAADAFMATNPVVGSQTFLVATQGKNLEKSYSQLPPHTHTHSISIYI